MSTYLRTYERSITILFAVSWYQSKDSVCFVDLKKKLPMKKVKIIAWFAIDIEYTLEATSVTTINITHRFTSV